MAKPYRRLSEVRHVLGVQIPKQSVQYAPIKVCQVSATPQDEDAEGKWLVTDTILNRAAHDALGHIHDRTPVIARRTCRISGWIG